MAHKDYVICAEGRQQRAVLSFDGAQLELAEYKCS